MTGNLPTADLQIRVSVDTKRLKPAMGKVSKFLRELDDLSNKRTRRKTFRVVRHGGRESLKKVEKKIAKEFEAIEDGTKRALERVLARVLHTSKGLVPVDTGLLKRTGFSMAVRLKTKVVGIVGYNIISGNVPPGVDTGAYYAVYVHEINAIHDPPTQWKFLSAALDQHKSSISSDMQTELKKRRKG
ncbi:hypothetical protein LCGC14_0232030 [marine sediment metagenome]|uniref:HK97 gp10 family phage protein n=1 Tax=marine sediment metagenome TaxID=412755 RepID=A0A0F9UA71_9ZZZZ